MAQRRAGVARPHGRDGGGEVGEWLDCLCGNRAATRERRRHVRRVRLQRRGEPVSAR